MKKSNPTLKDLAEKLGLSISTVSRALQDNPNINERTKISVKKLAKELGYYPHALAKSLKKKKTRTIGVIVPEISHFFFSAVIDGIEDVANKDGFNLLLTKSNENVKREILNTETLISNHVAGVIVSISQTTQTSKHFNHIINRGIPLVLFDRVLNQLSAPKVIGNDTESIYELVNHLISMDYQRIAFISGPSHLNISKTRLKGYQKALHDSQMGLNQDFILNVDLNEEGGFNGAKTLLNNHPNIDAFCCINDPVAVGVYNFLKSIGKSIPEEIGVTGFSNNPTSSIMNPSMTTVDQNGYDMGKKAAEILLNHINSEDVMNLNQTYVIESELIIRQSSSRK